MNTATADYDTLLEIGDEYCRYVVERRGLEGKPMRFIEGYANQLEYGDTDVGLEIKFDRKHHRTGNLFIEIEERRTVDRPFVASGIYRTDRSDWYGIGDYSVMYIYNKADLVALHQQMRCPSLMSARKTSRGFLIRPTSVSPLATWIWPNTWDGNHTGGPRP